MPDLQTAADHPPTLLTPNPWRARAGLLVVAGILISCFGLLIAASTAAI